MKTKKDYEEYLNDLYSPYDAWEVGQYMYKKEIGYINKYGTKLRKSDPVAFQVGFNEWKG